MYNRRNKLLLNLAQNRKQSDVYNSEDLTSLMENTIMEQSHEVIADEFLHLNSSDRMLCTENTATPKCLEKLNILGDDTFKEILDSIDDPGNITVPSLNVEDTTTETNNYSTQVYFEPMMQNELLDACEALLQTPVSKSRSVTPVCNSYNSFGASPIKRSSCNTNTDTLTSLNQVIDRIRELNGNNLLTQEPNTSECESVINLRPRSPFELNTSATTSTCAVSSECSTPTSATGRKRRMFHIDTTKKKRKCKKAGWLDTRRKLLVNLGKEHLSRGGKIQQGKVLKQACQNCKFQCHTKITEETRKQIFDLFWALGDHLKQWQFIGKNTKRFTKKRVTTDIESNRLYSVHYFLPAVSNVNSVVKVCKTMFKNTLNVSNQFIQSGIDKYNTDTGVCDNDKRGAHSNRKKVLTDASIKSVCDHVKSFCPVESHYTRKDSNKTYLDNELNFTKMFKMYQVWAAENNILEKVSTLRQYRDIVNSNLNIGFFVPKKDACDICTAQKNKPDTDESNTIYVNHIKNKNVARSLKLEDKNLAQAKPTEVSVATFDFQKILSTPHGETSSFYYKRKLSIFNFTIFDMGHKKGICYMWDETIAKRGSNEVASCLYNYITTVAEKGIKDIRLWSDNCGGQNRNRSVFLMYLYAAKKFNVHICHRFLEKGHTQQEGDSVHALIEKSSKRKELFTPMEWYTCVRWCKVNGEPYEVIEVSSEDILDFKSDTNRHSWNKNSNNEKVKWNQVKEVKVDPKYPSIISYKYDLGEDQAMNIDCSPRVNTRKRQTTTNISSLKKAYTNTLPITASKYKDLISLCDQSLIPPRYHNFYKNLKYTTIETGSISNEED